MNKTERRLPFVFLVLSFLSGLTLTILGIPLAAVGLYYSIRSGQKLYSVANALVLCLCVTAYCIAVFHG